MTSHKHSHDNGRAPLRLRPLPRPSRPSEPDAAEAPPPEDADSAEPSEDDTDDGPQDDTDAQEDASSASDSAWIHEWEQPSTGP